MSIKESLMKFKVRFIYRDGGRTKGSNKGWWSTPAAVHSGHLYYLCAQRRNMKQVIDWNLASGESGSYASLILKVEEKQP